MKIKEELDNFVNYARDNGIEDKKHKGFLAIPIDEFLVMYWRISSYDGIQVYNRNTKKYCYISRSPSVNFFNGDVIKVVEVLNTLRLRYGY